MKHSTQHSSAQTLTTTETVWIVPPIGTGPQVDTPEERAAFEQACVECSDTAISAKVLSPDRVRITHRKAV